MAQWLGSERGGVQVLGSLHQPPDTHSGGGVLLTRSLRPGAFRIGDAGDDLRQRLDLGFDLQQTVLEACAPIGIGKIEGHGIDDRRSMSSAASAGHAKLDAVS